MFFNCLLIKGQRLYENSFSELSGKFHLKKFENFEMKIFFLSIHIK